METYSGLKMDKIGFCGILGIHVPGTKTIETLPEMDSRYGQLRKTEPKNP